MIFEMTRDEKGAKAFKKLLTALVRQSKDDSVRNKEWGRLWSRDADYNSFLRHKENKP